MSRRKIQVGTTLIVSGTLILSLFGNVYADGLDTAQLSKGYSVTESLTG